MNGLLRPQIMGALLRGLETSIHEICGLEGDVAQLGERSVRNAEVVGSNPIVSTK